MTSESLFDAESGLEPTHQKTNLWRTTAVLLYEINLGFLQNGLTSIVVPQEMSYFAPRKAGLLLGALSIVSACIFATSPLVGYFVDRIGRRPLLIFGATVVSGGVALFIIGAISRSLPTYFAAYCATSVGIVVLSTVFHAIVADLSAAMPNKAGQISFIYTIYAFIGAGISYMAAGVLFQVSEENHGFYYFTACVTTVSNVALLAVVQPSSPRPAEPLIVGGSSTESPLHLRVCSVFVEWCGSELYHPWRRCVLARTLYYFAEAMIFSFILYYLTDCTNSKNPDASMSIIAFVTIGGSFAAAWPAGHL
jgi:MFS family permease